MIGTLSCTDTACTAAHIAAVDPDETHEIRTKNECTAGANGERNV